MPVTSTITTMCHLATPLVSSRFLNRTAAPFVASRLFPGIKLLGVIEAGWPSPAEEELLDTMSFDDFLAPNKDASYILRVNGDSMTGAGIHPGDMVLVERSSSPRDGEIVVAEVDGEWTLKYFRTRGAEVWLEAANSAYQAITPQRQLTIVAVVRAVVRKYS